MQSKNALQLQLFVLVLAEQGSFLRAAKKLRIPQPSLTRKVSQLEREIGVKLFDRTSRRLELTKAGRVFLPQAAESVSHAKRAWELARYQARMENGPIRVGYSPYIHSVLLPPLQRLRLPAVDSPHVVLETAVTAQLIERVLQGRLHAAIGIEPILEEDLWVHPLGQEAFCLCLPRNHALSAKTAVDLHDIDGELVFWIPPSLHPAFYKRIQRYIRRLGVQPVFKEVCATVQAIEFVAHGFGVALVPGSAARLSRTGVVFKSITDSYLRIETAIFVRKDERYGVLQETLDELLFQLQPMSKVQ